MKQALKEARLKAAEVLADHPDAIVKGRYVDVVRLAEELGVDVVSEPFKDGHVSGFIQMKTKSGRPVIVVNEDNPEVRQRFTVAHELGHFFLHKAQSVHIDDLDTADMVMYRNQVSSQATHLSEMEANQFAAELLMPTNMLAMDVEQLKAASRGMSEIVETLADRYQVSQAAMAIKLNKIHV